MFSFLLTFIVCTFPSIQENEGTLQRFFQNGGPSPPISLLCKLDIPLT